EHIQINAGVTRDFPEAIWSKIQDYDVVKTLLKLGALRIETEDKETTEPASAQDVDSIHDLPIALALELIESSFDPQQLRRWEAKEQRIKVRNAIGKRITAITEGNG
ncbi:MAG: hypothetical protein ACO3PY_05645, partial [Pontimonas sp.]